MKFYVAARFDMKEEVRDIYRKLEKKGHEIIADWTLHKPIQPYGEHKKLAKEYAIEDVNAVRDCDVFVLISNEGGSTGTYVELGVAIESNIANGKPKIYVIGEFNSNVLFYFHPCVNRRDSVDEVLDDMERI